MGVGRLVKAKLQRRERSRQPMDCLGIESITLYLGNLCSLLENSRARPERR